LPALTLGWGVIEHAARWLVQPNGPRAGQPWEPTEAQARFLLWWYALGEDGRWLFHHGVRRLAKGSGKSPFAAVLVLEELLGPVRLDRLDPSAPGGCVGAPVAMPLVQIAATAESQTANTMRMVRAMAARNSRVVAEYGMDVGKTVIYTPPGGQVQVITSSAAAAEGAEVTFVVEDETEHWVAATGGPELAAVLDRNLAKSSSRALETANAWEPGAGSVAEATFDAWRAQEEGRTRGTSRILYDARVAPAGTDLADEESLRAALEFVYDGCFWVDTRTIMERVWDPRTAPDVSRRFYLNQPTAAADAWTTPMLWKAREDTSRVVGDGEAVVLFFDGSKSRDATALLGCAMTDGHVFTVGVWEPDPAHDTDDVVPVAEVDAAVARAFDRWTVIAFFADVAEWEGFVKVTWPERYAAGLLVHATPAGKHPEPIAWDMRSHDYDFTMAAELCATEIVEGAFTHDGNAVVARHVTNARRRPGRWGVSIKKESPDSRRKIDAAVCVIGARMARRHVLASKEWAKRSRKRGTGRVLVLQD
jgi:plastocyanin